MKNKRVNLLKGIACYLVVLNHFHPGGGIGDISYTLSHCGVPVFFLISGFYFLDKDFNITGNRAVKKIKHILLLLSIHIVLYTGYELIHEWIFAGNVNALNVLWPIFNIRALLKAIVIGTGINGGGQWFLVSTLMAYIVLSIVFHLRWKNILIKYAHLIATVLFLIHIPVRMFVIKLGIQNLGELSLVETYSIRNIWFDAIPFMLYGVSIRKNLKTSIKHPLLLCILGAIMSVGEYFFSNKMLEPYQMNSVLYLGTIIAVTFGFLWAVGNGSQRDCLLSKIGDKYSMLIYFLHPIIGWTIQDLLGRTFLLNKNTIIQIVFSITVMITATGAALLLMKIRDKTEKIRG